MAVDITVVHPVQVHRPYGCGSAKRTLDDAAHDKRRAYGDACDRMGVRFEPFVLETWGGVQGSGKRVWRAIQLAATWRLRLPDKAQRLGALKRSLSLAVVRTVAHQLASLATATTDPNISTVVSPDDDLALQWAAPEELDAASEDMDDT